MNSRVVPSNVDKLADVMTLVSDMHSTMWVNNIPVESHCREFTNRYGHRTVDFKFHVDGDIVLQVSTK